MDEKGSSSAVIYPALILWGLVTGAGRVLRGGSWNNNDNNVRVANRNRNTPDNRNNNVGVRLVVGAPQLSPLLARNVVRSPWWPAAAV